VALDDAAARLGISITMPLATARAMHPALLVLDADEDADRATLNGIADWCDRFTPLVALDGASGLFLDITGCAHLFGGEAQLMRSLCGALTRQGFIVSAAIAGTAVAARALTRAAHSAIVPAGQEAHAVHDLPVSVLGVDPRIVTALRRAGLKTIGDVAGRTRHEIAVRFGAAFVSVLQQALGKEETPISPRRPAPDYIAEKRFAEPVATTDVLLRTLRDMAELLVVTMERHGKGARQLEAAFFRTDGVVRIIAVEAGQPVTQAAIVERLFVERIDALADPLDPGFGFDLVRLAASRTACVVQSQYGFDTSTHEAQDVAAFVDRLAARLGPRRIVCHVPQATHIPEQADVALPAQQVLARRLSPAWPEHPRHEPPLRPLRLLSPPEPIDVTAGFPDRPPSMFVWRQISHRLKRTEGPERIAMEWWRWRDPDETTEEDDFDRLHPARGEKNDAPVARDRLTRDYFRAEDEAGLRYWIYREGLYQREVGQFRWFLHGLFA
jgi:protein ImuB